MTLIMEEKTIHILIADDHKLFRRSLSSLIRTFRFPTLFSEASNGEEALGIIASNTIDVVLLDIQMPVLNGMETMKRIRQLVHRPQVLVLTQFDEPCLITYMLRHGANGFLSKDCEPEELSEAILGVTRCGYFLNDMSRVVMQKNMTKDQNLPSLEISSRELQVMVLLKEGKSSKEISKKLDLSIRTIESYRKALMKKTHSRNVADIVSLAFRTGIVT